MARPPKKGLLYFPKDTDYYDDPRIADLLNEYGPLGQTVYDIILTLVYKNGYYLEMPLENLSLLVLRIVGNRWAKKSAVTQVIRYCAEIGLFNDDLLSQNVITSVSIQRRFNEVTKRNKADRSRYWLLVPEGDSIPENEVPATETPISATETPISATETGQRKENVNEKNIDTVVSIYKGVPSELADVWRDFAEMRKKIKKPLTDRATQLIVNELQELAPGDVGTQRKILENSIKHCWQSVYPLSKPKQNVQEADRPPASYDIDEFERRLLHGKIEYKRQV